MSLDTVATTLGSIGGTKPRDIGQEILRVNDVEMHFPISRTTSGKDAVLKAVDGVTFSLHEGETLGLVGESGCGKSTLARSILGLNRVTGGAILYRGENLSAMSRRRRRPLRKRIQVVFQDPYASLDPRMRVEELIAEPLRINKQYSADRVAELLTQVGLDEQMGKRRPAEFSGGQRQRIGIARALALSPDILVLDEPVSALDVSIQAQVLNLLKRLQVELGLSYLFIGHDLSVVRHVSHRVAVMYLGKIVEIGDRDDVFNNPRHPYTKALLSAVPVADPKGRDDRTRIVLEGDLPDPANAPSGCPFRTRCFQATSRCAESAPFLSHVEDSGQGHLAACFYANELTRQEPEIGGDASA